MSISFKSVAIMWTFHIIHSSMKSMLRDLLGQHELRLLEMSLFVVIMFVPWMNWDVSLPACSLGNCSWLTLQITLFVYCAQLLAWRIIVMCGWLSYSSLALLCPTQLKCTSVVVGKRSTVRLSSTLQMSVVSGAQLCSAQRSATRRSAQLTAWCLSDQAGQSALQTAREVFDPKPDHWSPRDLP